MQYLRSFHSKSFTLLQQNQSAFTTSQRPETTKPKRFHNKTKGLKQQNQKRFRNKTKGLKQQNQSAFATKQKV